MEWQAALNITILLIICGLLFKKSKLIWISQIVWLWILLAHNTGGADWSVHLHFFMSSVKGVPILSASWLYSLICSIFNSLNLEFYDMNYMVSTVALFFYLLLIKRNTKNVSFVTSLFMIYPLADSIIQKRNFLACIIYLYGLMAYLKAENRRYFKYILCTLIAAQIHPTFYFYLVFIPLFKISLEKIKKTLPIFLGVVFALIPLLPRIANLLLGSTSLASKVNYYFTTLRIPLYQSICWWVVQLTFTFIFMRFSKSAVNLSNDEILMKQNLDKFNLLLLFILPLYYYEPTFFRIYRNILLVNYIFVAIYISKEQKITKKKLVNELMLVSFILVVFLSQFVFFGLGFEKLVVPLFEENNVIRERGMYCEKISINNSPTL